MRTRVVIQSRLSSSRLPGKALMDLGGMPLIELVARRASRTGFEVVVATSVEAYDDRIARHLERVGIRVVRGQLDDVLGRFLVATEDLDPTDRVIRLTGDNPVGDASLVQEMLDEMAGSGYDYGRVDIERVPEGLGVEAFTVEALRRAGSEAVDAYDREHVTPWIRRNLGEYLFVPDGAYGDPAVYRCTTDCLHDYDRVSRLFDGIEDPVSIGWREVIARLDGMVRGFGTLAEPAATPAHMTSALLGVDRLHGRSGSIVRECFAEAVNRGISHVFLRAEQAPSVATGTLPGLRQRLGAMLVVDDRSELETMVALERSFAHLGQRRAAAVLVDTALPSVAWAVARRYQAEGVVGQAGLFAVSPEQVVPRIEGQSILACVVADEDADLSPLVAAVGSGLMVIVVADGLPGIARRVMAEGAAHAVAIQPAFVDHFEPMMAALRR